MFQSAKVSVAATVLLLGLAGTGRAGPTSVAARETAEFMARTFGKEAASRGVEALARQVGSLALRHGEEVYAAARKVGPLALRLIMRSFSQRCEKLLIISSFSQRSVFR